MALAETTVPADADMGLHPERPGPMQAADFERWRQDPEHPVELISGWVVPMSPGSLQTGDAVRELIVLLDPLVKKRGWRLALDARHRLVQPPQTVVFPDLAIHGEREVTLGPGTETITRVPELVLEILGEETVERDRAPRGAKFLAYQLSGVQEYFYAWPDGREAAAFRLEDGRYRPLAADGDGFFESHVLGVPLRLVPAGLRQ
jgi:Uma2 family endonuclease